MKKIILLLTFIFSYGIINAEDNIAQENKFEQLEEAIKNLDEENVKKLLSELRITAQEKKSLLEKAEEVVDEKQSKRFLWRSWPDLWRWWGSCSLTGASIALFLISLGYLTGSEKIVDWILPNKEKKTENKNYQHQSFSEDPVATFTGVGPDLDAQVEKQNRWIKIKQNSLGLLGLITSPFGIYYAGKFTKKYWNLDYANSDYKKAKAIYKLISEVNI